MYTPLLESDFNPLILESFLTGLYHSLAVQVIWKLRCRRAPRLYIAALLLLWASCTLEMLCSWLDSHHAFVVSNSSPASIGQAFMTYPLVVQNIAMTASFLISDGIVVWRSHVLMRKSWITALLVTLMLASAACNIVSAIMPSRSATGILLAAISLAISALTTIIATMIIALKIFTATRGTFVQYSYTRVIDIVVQSAALESLLLIAEAAICIVSFKLTRHLVITDLLKALTQADGYLYACRTVVMGVAPTLIAFRSSAKIPEREVDCAIHTHSPSRSSTAIAPSEANT